ncbi:MAG: hypothetical protein PGN13_15990 [Patulibacter minatonensis]
MPAHARQLPPAAGRRLRALRVILDFSTPAAAVEALGVTISADAWREIEVPGRPRRMWDYEADEIADAAGVPRTFFTAPLERLGDTGGETS